MMLLLPPGIETEGFSVGKSRAGSFSCPLDDRIWRDVEALFWGGKWHGAFLSYLVFCEIPAIFYRFSVYGPNSAGLLLQNL